MKDEIYLIISGSYSDWEVIGYTTVKVDAEKYCANKNNITLDENNDIYISDHYVVTTSKIINIPKIQLYQYHEVVFDIKKSMRKEPDRYKLYTGEKRGVEIQANLKIKNHSWVSFQLTAQDREHAERIAQDYYSKFLYSMEEIGLEKTCEIMKIKQI